VADGVYAVTLTVTDDDGASDSASQAVTVSSPGGNGNDSGGETLLQEDFDTGMPAGWTVVNEGIKWGPPVWEISSGTLAQSTNLYGGSTDGSGLPKPGTYLRYDAGGAWTNYRASFTLRSDDDDALGLMFRMTDSDNYYRFSWDKERSYRRLVNKVDGSFILLAEDNAPFVQGQTYQVDIESNGDMIEVRIDDTLIFTVNDTTHAAGTVAFYSWANTGARFDGLTIHSP
jgi:hypothetical protein